MRILPLVIIVATFLLIFPLAANTQDITALISEYEGCKEPDICKTLEITLIKSFLKEAKVLDVLEEMPEENNIEHEIIQANLSDKISKDYIFKIVIGRLGYIVVLKRDVDNNNFVLLPIIEKGFVYNVHAKDVTGDGIEELMFRGYGTGTGYWEEWLAIYKYKGKKMKLIWSGVEKEVTAIGGKEKTVSSRAYLYNIPGYKSMEIYQSVVTEIIDAETRKVLSEEATRKRFEWSSRDFKFIESKGNIKK